MLGNQHTLILTYLENLCAHDETVVRERSVNSITKLLDLYSDNDINNYIIPLVLLWLSRSWDLPVIKPILLAECLLPSWCVMFIQELAPTKKKLDINSQIYQMNRCYYFREWQQPKFLKCVEYMKNNMSSVIWLVSLNIDLPINKIK